MAASSKYMNDRQGKFLAMVDRKRNLMSEAPEDLREKISQEISDLDEKISGEAKDLLEKKEDFGGNVERRSAEVEGRERYSSCWEWCHSEGSSWVLKIRNRG